MSRREWVSSRREGNDQPSPTPARKWISGLGCLVLLLGLGNVARMGGVLWFARFLPDLPMTVSWAYLAAMGGFWGAALVVCAVGLMPSRPWGRRATLAAVTLYQAHVWLNHLLFDANDYAHKTWGWSLVFTGLLLAFTWGLLNWPSVRSVFSISPSKDSRASPEH